MNEITTYNEKNGGRVTALGDGRDLPFLAPVAYDFSHSFLFIFIIVSVCLLMRDRAKIQWFTRCFHWIVIVCLFVSLRSESIIGELLYYKKNVTFFWGVHERI